MSDPEPPQKETDIARRIRADGLASGRASTAIATEIFDQCGAMFGTSQIKAHRLALGVALSDVVAQVRALYRIEGKPIPKIGETLLSAYESGHKRPGPEYLHYLCSVYRVDPDGLGYRGPCICGRRHARPAGAAPSGAAPSADQTRRDPDALVGTVVVPRPAYPHGLEIGQGNLQGQQGQEGQETGPRDHDRAGGPAATDVGEEDIVLRRSLLQLLAGAGVPLDGQFLGAVDNLRRRMDDTLVNATVSPTMLDQWEETTLRYGQQYQATPSLRMLCDVLLDFSEVRRMCQQRQPIELQERLCRLAAQLSGLSGLIMINLGDHRMARSFFRTARTAADETGDRPLRAWVTVRESLVPMYYGDVREAIHLARKAQDLAGRAPSVAAAMAPAVEARALGQLALRGQDDVEGSARRALARGRAVFDQLSTADRSDLAFGFTERQLSFYEGDTLTNIGDHRHGDETLSRALTLYSGTERLDRTLIRLDRATCRLQAGEPEAALAAAQEAITELPSEHRTDIIVHRARQLGAEVVAKHGEISAVRTFRAALSGPSVHGPVTVPADNG
jgi:tetratricopeptide (TPR) repeat protein